MRRLVLPWRLLTFVVLIMGFAMTLWSSLYLFRTEYTSRQTMQQTAVEKLQFEFMHNWKGVLEGLQNYGSVFAASEHVTAEEFYTLTSIVTEQHKALKAVAFSPAFKGAGGIVSHPPMLARTPLAQEVENKKSTDAIALFKVPNYLSKAYDDNRHIVLAYPVGPNSRYGTLVAIIDIQHLLAGLNANQRIDFSIQTQAKIPATLAQTSYRVPNTQEDESTQTTQDVLGTTWVFHWFPQQESYQWLAYLPGFFILLAGLVMTGTFGWVIWLQQGVADLIHQQVVERTNQLESASRRFRLITDNAYDLIAITNTTGQMEYTNSAYHRVLGYNREELRNAEIMTLLHPADVQTLKNVLNDVAQGRNAIEFTCRMKHKSGDWLYVEAVAKGLHDTDWTVKSIVIHGRDVTSRKQFAEDLARSEQRFRDFADASADWLWEVDENLCFTYVSPGVSQVLGYTPEDMMGSMQMDTLFNKDEESARELIEKRISRQEAYKELEFWTNARDGGRVCLRVSGLPVNDEQGKFMGYRGVATNITASQEARDDMFKLATTDHLTGLLNRRRLMEELERSVSLAQRHNTKGVLMFIDLDRFKEINDTHGHEAGDEILRGITEILQTSFRNTDIIARLGGDEFAIIMHNCDIPTAQEKCQFLIDRINAFELDYRGARLSVTMSIGMIVYPQEDKDAESLMMSADLAMYRAKDMGRNRMFIDADDNSGETMNSVRTQLKWVKRLRTCLETGDFEMHFQPIVPAAKRHRPLFEALLRIYDEEGNIGSPALYIDAAEHFGLIQQLDLSVIERCFATMQELMQNGIDADFSINLSSRTLGDPEVSAALHKLYETYDIDSNRIMFEVTETMAIHDPSSMRDLGEIHAFINDLRAMGFRFALDDFGTGFSSFNYIRLLPVDVVKIDGSFVKDVVTNDQDRIFIESMVLLAHGMGIQTIAEFVEDQHVTQALLDLGIDYAQGWHIGKPHGNIQELTGFYTGKVMKNFLTEDKPPQFAIPQKAKPKPIVKRRPKADKAEPKVKAKPKAAAKKSAPKKASPKKETAKKAPKAKKASK